GGLRQVSEPLLDSFGRGDRGEETVCVHCRVQRFEVDPATPDPVPPRRLCAAEIDRHDCLLRRHRPGGRAVARLSVIPRRCRVRWSGRAAEGWAGGGWGGWDR